MEEPINVRLCPVCDEFWFMKWDEYCPVCGWCHSFLQEMYPDDKKMDNIMSLNEAKQAFKEGKEIY